MTRPELIIASALLIAFVVFMRWALSGVLATFGFETFMAVGGGGIIVVLTIAYVVDRRRGHLPRWLQPKDRHPPSRD
jgi:hypothetical protein